MLQDNNLCATPNQHAKPANMEIIGDGVLIHGYQEFYLDRRHIHPLANDHSLQRKVDLLSSFFQPKYLAEKTFLDLGANAAYYCFWALQEKAARATAVDIDDDYLRIVETTSKRLGYDNLEIFKANVADWKQPADVVIALGLIHWLYSATAVFGDLDAAITRLAELTNNLLIIEWIAPEDPAIEFFHHLDWNKESIKEPYTFVNFEKALSRHFEKVEVIGAISATRAIYAAFRSANRIDLTCPLPRLYPRENLLSSQLLAIEEDIEYWSCIYEWDNVIVKQATLDLAVREAKLLSEFNSEYFPKVLSSRHEENYSVVVLEKIDGKSLKNSADEIGRDPDTFFGFIEDCLNILDELNIRKIFHRDIRAANMLIRNRKPVLIDFGWANLEGQPYFTPRGLGDKEKSPDGVFCDVYSMGRVLEQYCPPHHSRFLEVINLMTAPDLYLRITNIGLLRKLFALAYKKGSRNE